MRHEVFRRQITHTRMLARADQEDEASLWDGASWARVSWREAKILAVAF